VSNILRFWDSLDKQTSFIKNVHTLSSLKTLIINATSFEKGPGVHIFQVNKENPFNFVESSKALFPIKDRAMVSSDFTLDKESLVIGPVYDGSEQERKQLVKDKISSILGKLESFDEADSGESLYIKKQGINYVLDLSDYDLGLFDFRIFVHGESDRDIGFWVKVIYEVSGKEHFVNYFSTKSENNFSSQIIWETQGLIQLLKGNEFEVHNNIKTAQAFDRNFWDDWDLEHKSYQRYQQEIHPTAVNTVVNIVKTKFNNKYVNIFDIFSADGSFVEKLRNELSENKKISYSLLDGSKQASLKAKQKFEDKDDVNVLSSRDILSLERFDSLFQYRPQIVIAIGGLTINPLESKEDAIKIVEMVYELLSYEGYFVVSGLTRTFLNSNDYKAISFNVINKSIPQHFFWYQGQDLHLKELYILRKPNEESTRVIRDQAMMAAKKARWAYGSYAKITPLKIITFLSVLLSPTLSLSQENTMFESSLGISLSEEQKSKFYPDMFYVGQDTLGQRYSFKEYYRKIFDQLGAGSIKHIQSKDQWNEIISRYGNLPEYLDGFLAEDFIDEKFVSSVFINETEAKASAPETSDSVIYARESLKMMYVSVYPSYF
ncbi:MAG: hypothetical protein P9X22_00825, partial [Candidatus Zapsychrus exili]|nr:hypothetical protein [Candidatus Zapsychrus exili]